ncbi:hypothetical protein JB92DRAFT_1359035 [Gautieria morchelliformis]|nr:hypothetical protein JB92DRAFT_1359035 [Gautieria morchelliformis]
MHTPPWTPLPSVGVRFSTHSGVWAAASLLAQPELCVSAGWGDGAGAGAGNNAAAAAAGVPRSRPSNSSRVRGCRHKRIGTGRPAGSTRGSRRARVTRTRSRCSTLPTHARRAAFQIDEYYTSARGWGAMTIPDTPTFCATSRTTTSPALCARHIDVASCRRPGQPRPAPSEVAEMAHCAELVMRLVEHLRRLSGVVGVALAAWMG